MGVIKLMSVGKSGVGKSTIGNCIIDGDPNGQTFPTGYQAHSVTHEPKWAKTADCHYCDVPGLPDTNPNNTKSFYNKIIHEARKELSVILFVFKYERIDEYEYKKAKMLFRELMKSQAIKVLVINDMTNYQFGGGKMATPEDYQRIADSIKKWIGIEFAYTVNMTGSTMLTSLNNLKTLLCDTTTHASPDLKTYEELKGFVQDLSNKKNHEQVVYEEALKEVENLQQAVEGLEAATAGAIAVTNICNVINFVTFGVGLAAAIPVTLIGSCVWVALELKRKDLAQAKEKLSKDKLEAAARDLERACISFEELEKAMTW